MRNRFSWGLLFFPFYLFANHSLIESRFLSLTQGDKLYKEVVGRLEALRTYVPAQHYRWNFHWENGHEYHCGSLRGSYVNGSPWVEIAFDNGDRLCFYKGNLTWAFYPCRLCLCHVQDWWKPLRNNPALNVHLLTMSFLNWTIVSYKKTAFLGRKALQIFLKHENEGCAEIFLDQFFNTLLQAKIELKAAGTKGSFTLKRLKKFASCWGLKEAAYELNGQKTILKIDSISIQEE